MEKVDVHRWSITVFNQGDKVASHLIHSEDEKHARALATEWVENKFGSYKDWSLHKVTLDWR